MKINYKIIIKIVVAFTLIITGILLYLNDFSTPEQNTFQNSNHIWSTYKNNKFGFEVDYPSDISEPNEIHRPDKKYIDEFTKEYDLIIPPKESDNIQFIDLENHKIIFLWIEKTKAFNINEWFKATYGEDGDGYFISATTTIANTKAIYLKEKVQGLTYSNYNLHFIKNGNVYSIYFNDTNLTTEEIDYIKNSFHFMKWGEIK